MQQKTQTKLTTLAVAKPLHARFKSHCKRRGELVRDGLARVLKAELEQQKLQR